MRTKYWRVIALFGALALSLAACGGDDDEAPDEAEEADSDGDEESGAADDDEQGDDEQGDAGEEGEDSDGRDSDTLRIAYPRPVITLDQMSLTPEPTAPRRAVFEQLIGFNAELEPSPQLAASWETSDDNTTWTFELQEGVTFHNGDDLTADDVVASWERYKSMGARYFELESIESVSAVGDLTIEIKTDSPQPNLIESMAPISGSWAIMPASIAEAALEDELTEDQWIGTGPYQFESREPEVSIVLKRYEDYWGGPDGESSMMAGERNAYFETVEVLTIPDNATRVSALQSGEVDVIHNVPGDEAPALADNPDIEVQPIAPGSRIYIKFNSRIPPFDDPELRDAVRMGIDPEALMAGHGDPDFWRVNNTPRYQQPQWTWIDQSDRYPVDVEAARQMVEESDYDGEPITLLASPARADEYVMVVPLEAYLTEIGFNVTIEAVDAATFGSIRSDLDAWNIKQSGGGSFVGTTYLAASAQDRTGEDWPNIDQEWFDSVDEVIETEGRENRLEAIEEVYEIHAEANNEMWIGDVFVISGYRADIQGVPDNDFTLGFWNMWRE